MPILRESTTLDFEGEEDEHEAEARAHTIDLPPKKTFGDIDDDIIRRP